MSCNENIRLQTSGNVTDAHLHLAKLWGITLLAGAVLSFASLCYRDDEDAVGTLKAKLIVSKLAQIFTCGKSGSVQLSILAILIVEFCKVSVSIDDRFKL